MATEKRISEQGTVFDVAIVRDFLQAALNHDAVVDEVNDLLFEHVVYSRFHPSVITANLRPLITEVLDTATPEDWQYVAAKLIEEALETLKPDPESKPPRRNARLKGDPGELREKLAEIYAREHVSLIAACHAQWIIWRISLLTDISREQIRADAKADAQAIQAADSTADQSSGLDAPPVIGGDVTVTVTGGVAAELIAQANIRPHNGASWRLRDGTATTDPRRALTDALVVLAEKASDALETDRPEDDLPNLYVRQLTSEEVDALKFINLGQQADDLAARNQAAILLGSNAGCTPSQIAAMLVVDEAKVREVIADFNERGIAGIAETRQAEREHVIQTARNVDPESFDTDTREARPGKYEGESDLRLVVALDILNGHGLADESAGDVAMSGYAWRVNRFVGIEDSQGFVRAEDWPTARQAAGRLRDFYVPTEDEES